MRCTAITTIWRRWRQFLAKREEAKRYQALASSWRIISIPACSTRRLVSYYDIRIEGNKPLCQRLRPVIPIVERAAVLEGWSPLFNGAATQQHA